MLTSTEVDSKKTGSTIAVCTDKSHVEQSRSDIRPSTRTEPAYFSSCRSFSESPSEMINRKICVENEARLCQDNIYNIEPVSEVTECNPVINYTDMENDCALYDDGEYCNDSTTPSRPTILLYNNDDEDDNIAMNDANHMEQSRQSPNPQLSVCTLDMVNDPTSYNNDDNNIISNNHIVEPQEELSEDRCSETEEKFVEFNHTENIKRCEFGEKDKDEATMHLKEEIYKSSKHNVLPQTTLPRCLTEPHYSLPYSEAHQTLLPPPPPPPPQQQQQQSHTHCKETENKQIEHQDAKCANTFHTHKPHYNNFMISGNNNNSSNRTNVKRDNVYLATNQPHRVALSAPNCMFEECKTRFGHCDVRPSHKSNSMHRRTELNNTFYNNNSNNYNNNITSNNPTYPTPCTNVDDNLNYSQDGWHRSSASKEVLHALVHLPHKDNTRRRSQREKQISYGYVTDGYKNMIKLITHDPLLRSGGVIPLSPPDVNVGSKRTWDIQLRKWRRALHMFDYVYIDDESENEVDNNDIMKNSEDDHSKKNNCRCNEECDAEHEQCVDAENSSSSESNINTQQSKANENSNPDKINTTSREEDSPDLNKFTGNTGITNVDSANSNLSRKAAVIEAQRQQWVSPNFAHVSKTERVRYTLASLYGVRYSHLVPHKIPVEDNLRCILRSELFYESVRSVVPQSASSLTKGTDISPLAAGIKIHIAPSAAVLRQQHEQQLQHEQLKSILRSQSIPQQAEELVQGLTQSVMKRRSSESISRSPSPQICPRPQETHGLLTNASPSFSPECSPEMRHLVYSQSSDMCSSELPPFTHSRSSNTETLQLHDHVHENVSTKIDHTHNEKVNAKINVNNMMNNEQHEEDYSQDNLGTNETEKYTHIQNKENCYVGKWNARNNNNPHKCNTHTEEKSNKAFKHNKWTLNTSYHNNVVSRKSNFAPIDYLTDSTNQHAAHDIKTNLTCTSETALSSSHQSPTAAPLSLWEVKSTLVNSAPNPQYLPSEQQEEQQYALQSNKERMHHSNYDNSKTHYKHQTSSLEPPPPLRLLQREVNTTFCERNDVNNKQISNNVNITHDNLSLVKQEKESLCTKEWENLRYNEHREKEHELYEEEMANQWDKVQEHYWPQHHIRPETTTQYASNQQVEKALIRNENMTRSSEHNFTNNCHNSCHMNSWECTCQANKRVSLPTTSVVCAPGPFIREQSCQHVKDNRQVDVPQYQRDCGKNNISISNKKTNENIPTATNIHEYTKYFGQSNLPFQKTFREQSSPIKYQQYNEQEMKQQQQQHELKLQRQQKYECQKQFSAQRYNHAMYDRLENELSQTKQKEWSDEQMQHNTLKPHYHQKEELLINNADALSQNVNNICHTYHHQGDRNNYFNAHYQHDENKLVLEEEGSNVQTTEYYKSRPMHNRNITNNYQLTQQSKYASNQPFIKNQNLYYQSQTSARVQHSNKYFDKTFAWSNNTEDYDRISTNFHSRSDQTKFLANRVHANQKIVQSPMQEHVNWLQNDREPQTIERFVTKLTSSCPKAKSANLTNAMQNKDTQNDYH